VNPFHLIFLILFVCWAGENTESMWPKSLHAIIYDAMIYHQHPWWIIGIHYWCLYLSLRHDTNFFFTIHQQIGIECLAQREADDRNRLTLIGFKLNIFCIFIIEFLVCTYLYLITLIKTGSRDWLAIATIEKFDLAWCYKETLSLHATPPLSVNSKFYSCKQHSLQMKFLYQDPVCMRE
jgi:hypothetical protein